VLTAIAVLAIVAACATPGMPPGGPTASSFPRVIATLPDTGAVNVKPGRVLVRYDDVINEQAAGGNLSNVVLISPWDGEPKVDWRRTGMAIAPRRGWRANTAYTITILPGVGDIKGQPSPYGYVLRFSTGTTIPKSVLRGVAFDWVNDRSLPKATVQAVDVRDTSLVHVTVADSNGRFELGAVPPGTYIVRAIDEKTPNRQLDPREPWDTVTVTLRDSARAELYTFIHDTMPIRINELRQTDSVTITLVLDKPLLPGAPIGIGAVRVQKSDSSVIDVRSVLTGAEAAIVRAREDSIARAADTTAKNQPPESDIRRNTIDPNRRRDTLPSDPAPKPNRKPPQTELEVKLRTPLQPASTYRVSLTGLRNLVNRTGETTRLLIIPKATPPDSLRTGAPGAPRDSTAKPGAPRDSTAKPGAPRDSTAKPPVRDSTARPPVPPAGGARPPQRPPR
jgi:hypothetical protein